MTDASATIMRHSSLLALRWRVRGRWLLERLRVGLLWALVGDVPLALAGRASGYPDWPAIAFLWTALALLTAVAVGLRRWPDDWAVAVAADGQGLAERVSSALYAARIKHPAARLLAVDANRALARIDPAGYPLLPWGRVRWRELGAALAVALAVLLPLPGLGDAGRRAAEAQSVEAARRIVTSLEARLVAPEPLIQAAAAGLRASEQQLAEARTAEDAARILEGTQERLAGQAKAEDYAWQRAMEGLSAVWRGNLDLGALSQAISSGDQAAMEWAVADLSERASALEPAEQQALKQSLQAGANAARDVPDLAAALRQAAAQIGQTAASGQGRPGAVGALGSVSSLLSTGMSRSSGMQALRQTIAGIGQARAGLGAVSASGAVGEGTASSSSSGAQAGAGGGTGGGGSGSDGQSGTGSGSGAPGGTGSGSGAGSGSGNGLGSGGSGGTGGAGSGAGSGAGAGGDPSSGQPGSANGGATVSGGNAEPGLRGATNYESVYVPSLMGGDGGPRVAASGDARSASGETVELPNSPLELGSIRPYSEAYGRYEAAARQSLSRQPLPLPLQGVVQRYFSAIAPDGE